MTRFPTVAALTISALIQPAAAQPFAHTYPERYTPREAMSAALQARAQVVRPWMTTATGKALAEATDTLPPRSRRWRWATNAFTDNTFTMEEHPNLPEAQKRRLDFFGISELLYYAGWTSDAPFIEYRALDLAVVGTRFAEPEALAGARVLLVDPGVTTHAWTLARLGAHVTIVNDSQRFRAIYNSPSDQGSVIGINGAPNGSITLIDGDWPADETIDPGDPFDLIIAINTLNRGRVDPTAHHMRSAPPNEPTKALGDSEAHAAQRLSDALAPGGRILLYNWGLPARPNLSPDAGGDTCPAIGSEAASKAGLRTVAIASDASVFNSILGVREGVTELRRNLDDAGTTAPQLSVMYAVFERP